jgi:O-antigen/teichoic acid export membrane protein
MQTQGAILSTSIGYLAAIFINLYVIKTYSRYPFRLVIRRTVLILSISALMWAGTFMVYKVLLLFLSPASTMQSILIIIVCAIVGAAIYLYLSFKSKLINLLFGDRVDRIKKKLRLPV